MTQLPGQKNFSWRVFSQRPYTWWFSSGLGCPARILQEKIKTGKANVKSIQAS
jgi:hypothetical protein